MSSTGEISLWNAAISLNIIFEVYSEAQPWSGARRNKREAAGE